MPSGPELRGRASRVLLAAATLAGAFAPKAAAVDPAAMDTTLVHGAPAVHVAGRAIVGAGVLHDRSLPIAVERDSTGVWLFSRALGGLRLRAGDSVEATGVLHRYRGTTELVAFAVRRSADAGLYRGRATARPLGGR